MNRLIAKLATLHHTRAFVIGALDSPSERGHFFGMLAELGIPAIVGVVLFTNVLMEPVQEAPYLEHVTDPLLPDAGITILARAPGTDPKFALNFCNDPATKAEAPAPVPEDGGRITLTRGLDTLSWPGYASLTARYQTTNEGSDVDMTPASVACFQKKAGR